MCANDAAHRCVACVDSFVCRFQTPLIFVLTGMDAWKCETAKQLAL